jgi:hypothetical protein
MFEDAAHPQIALKLVFVAITLTPQFGVTVPMRPGLF